MNLCLMTVSAVLEPVHTARLQEIVRERHIGLAMIYTTWFKEVPSDWLRVATLYLGSKLFSAAEDEVAFFATSAAGAEPLRASLRAFAPTLPPGVRMNIEDDAASGH